MTNCIHCKTEIEKDDNFCPKCGHWTTKGYVFLQSKDNIKRIMNGDSIKQDKRFSILMSLLSIGLLLFTFMIFIRGDDLFKPFVYLKKQVTNYIYGYNTSIIKSDNKYKKEDVQTYEDAIEIIKKDINEQSFLCENDIEVALIQYNLENNYNIPIVSFCDISYNTATKLYKVISKMYELFPNIQGTLTNITVTNASSKSEYIAYFQPLYQFVNINEDINLLNKVNKTQILLNSYYFLNEEILSSNLKNVVGENWYVNDATWESTIAHEFGHLISFSLLLKDNNLLNITLETYENYEQIENIIETFDSGVHSNKIINEALDNYNKKYNSNYDIYTFAQTISKYASALDEKNNLIADEVIAEAIHDYYLHGNDMKLTSKVIVSVIKNRLY